MFQEENINWFWSWAPPKKFPAWDQEFFFLFPCDVLRLSADSVSKRSISVFYNQIILLIYVAMKQFVDQDLYWNLNSLTSPKLMCPE